jgi:hypothetical protein
VIEESTAIFQTKIDDIISKVAKISDELQKERLKVIVEGMLKAVNDKGILDTALIIDAIKNKFQ